jgi:hypothetical protein
MPTLEKRGEYWRVKIRRKEFPNQTRSFDTKAQAQRWARDLERDMDRGFFVDRTESEKNSRRDLVPRQAGRKLTRLNRVPSACGFGEITVDEVDIHLDRRRKRQGNLLPRQFCGGLTQLHHRRPVGGKGERVSVDISPIFPSQVVRHVIKLRTGNDPLVRQGAQQYGAILLNDLLRSQHITDGRVGFGGIDVTLNLVLIVRQRRLYLGLVHILHPALGLIDRRTLLDLIDEALSIERHRLLQVHALGVVIERE